MVVGCSHPGEEANGYRQPSQELHCPSHAPPGPLSLVLRRVSLHLHPPGTHWGSSFPLGCSSCSLRCVSFFSAQQGGAGSGFLGALSIPEKCEIWLLAVGAWLPACQALSLFLPRWAGCLVNRKKAFGSKQLRLGPPKEVGETPGSKTALLSVLTPRTLQLTLASDTQSGPASGSPSVAKNNSRKA